jgi:hypothetical protein
MAEDETFRVDGTKTASVAATMGCADRIFACVVLLSSLSAGCSSSAAMPSSESASDPVASAGRDATAPADSSTGAAPGALFSGRPTHVPGFVHPSADAGTGTKDAAADAPPSDASVPPPGDATPYGQWQPIATPPPFTPDVALLLTDGTVMVHDYQEGSKFWRLSPDIHGSYVTGTWSTMASLPAGYEPTFFSSAVLADGRVVIIGGEYNEGADVETPLGAIYDPPTDTWTPIQAPTPLEVWYIVGDAPSVVLPDGTWMIGSIPAKQQATFDARTLTWTTISSPGNGKADDNAEEGWTLLPNGKVLTVDVGIGLGDGRSCPSTTNSELFDPAVQTWSSAGNTGPALPDTCVGEIGPAVLRPDGTVFAIGATGNTAVYGVDGGWTAGPTFPVVAPGQLDLADGCAVLLPNGNVLAAASPGDYQPPASFFEFDGTNLTQVSATQNAANDSSFNVFFLLLPSGQVLSIDYSPDIELYASTGAPSASWAPTITVAPTTVVRGTTYRLEGTQLNGLSQAVAYGDDYQGATDYPLVRITNDATGHVFYGRTHDHSTMAVATGTAPVSTLFEAPSQAEVGASSLVVVANGIPSAPVAVTLQ